MAADERGGEECSPPGRRSGMSGAINTIMEALLVVVLLGGFIAAMAAIVFVGRYSHQTPAFAFQPAQSHVIPHRNRAILFSRAERKFYQTLRAVIPDHLIFVKVRVADLVSMRPRRSFWEHFNPINRKRIDFVVCDPTLAPVLAIELDHGRVATRSGFGTDIVNSVLASASLPVVHVPEKRSYLFNELRRLLTPYLSVPRPLL